MPSCPLDFSPDRDESYGTLYQTTGSDYVVIFNIECVKNAQRQCYETMTKFFVTFFDQREFKSPLAIHHKNIKRDLNWVPPIPFRITETHRESPEVTGNQAPHA